MPFIPTANAVEVKLISQQNSVPIVNVWNVNVSHPVTLSDLNATLAIFDAWLTSDYKTIIQPSVTFQQWILTDISVANGQQIISTPTAPNGTASGVQSAANAAFVASLRTAHTGRGFRGRTYVPGVPQAFVVDAQHMSTGYATSVNVVFVNLLNALIAGGSTLSVLSRYLNKALRIAGLLTDVISIVTDTKIDSQRRRTAN
jgi:hypothetical protein